MPVPEITSAEAYESYIGGKRLRAFPGDQSCYTSARSPDGALLAVLLYDGPSRVSIHLWEVTSGRELPALPRHSGRFFNAMRFSADSKRLMIATASARLTVNKVEAVFPGFIVVWDVAAGKKLYEIDNDFANVALSGDGETAAVETDNREIRVFSLGTGKTRCLIPAFGTFQFTPDDNALISTGDGQPPRLWDVSSGKETAVLHGQGRTVFSVAWSPNGRIIAAGIGDDNQND